MNLGQLKKYAVKLIDEYSNNIDLTDDGDIKSKLNDLFNIAQIEVSQIKKIQRIKNFEIKEKTTEEYNTVNLPSSFMQLNKLRYFSSNNTILRYYIQPGKLKIHKDNLGKFELEYYAFPDTITEETEDDYELELDIDAQMVLPYYVASDILKSDVSANYTAFEAKYNAKIEVLMRSAQAKNESLITINQMFGTL